MTRTELVQAVARQAGTTQKAAGTAVDGVFRSIADALQKGDEVRLPGFGVFAVKMRAARKGRDLRTGASIEIPERNVVVFRASKTITV